MPTKNLHLGKDSNAWRWVVVFAAFLLSLLTDGVRFSFGLLYKELLVDFNKGRGVTAGIGSLMFGTMNFSGKVSVYTSVQWKAAHALHHYLGLNNILFVTRHVYYSTIMSWYRI